MAVTLHSFTTDTALAAAAAARWLEWVRSQTTGDRHPTVALAGGRITGSFYDEICRQAGSGADAVRAVEYFWGDERCVPPESADSNFKLAEDRLFRPMAIPTSRQHRIEGELPPAPAAKRITEELTRLATNRTGDLPTLDLVLLGMGEDGHVASLFPGATAEVVACKGVYLPVIGPKPPPQRISLSYAALAAAKEVWVLVAGNGKLEPLRDALGGASSHGLGKVISLREEILIFESVGLGR